MQKTYIVCHLTHETRRELMEDILKVYSGTLLGSFAQSLLRIL